MANAQTEIKGGYSLAIIPFLNRVDNWLDFFNGIKTFLIIGSQFNWLKNYKNILVNPLTKQKKKYKFIIYTIRACSNYNAKQIINKIINYYTIYKTLKKNYKLKSDGTFHKLFNQFFTISLANYKSIKNYTEAIKKL